MELPRSYAYEAPRLRRSGIWFEDGSVVLQAGTVQFRVHKSILAMHSTAFKDTFTLSQPIDARTVDGCPVFAVSDSPTDIEHVLRALYDISNSRTPTRPSTDSIAARLRLGKKYEFHGLYEDAFIRLITEFPGELHSYDALEWWTCLAPGPSPVKAMSDLIALAWVTHTLVILPALFLRLCSLPGSLSDLITHDEILLDKRDLKRCIDGRERLIWAQYTHTFGWLDNSIPCGRTAANCEARRMQILRGIWMPLPKCDPLRLWDTSWEEGLCRQCISNGKHHHEGGRKVIWSELPTFFGLPQWEDLFAGTFPSASSDSDSD